MIPAVLGLGAWVAKGAALVAVLKLAQLVTSPPARAARPKPASSKSTLSGTGVSYQYDVLDRVIAITHQGSLKVQHFYDALGRVREMRDTVGSTRYTYSADSDLVRVEDPLGRVVQYRYNAANYLTQRTDPENLVTNFTHNARGQVSQVTHDGLTANYLYNALGVPTTVTWNSGLSEQYQYSSQGELMNRPVDFPGVALESESLIRDGLGRKSQAIFNLPGSQRTHNYDYSKRDFEILQMTL